MGLIRVKIEGKRNLPSLIQTLQLEKNLIFLAVICKYLPSRWEEDVLGRERKNRELDYPEWQTRTPSPSSRRRAGGTSEHLFPILFFFFSSSYGKLVLHFFPEADRL